MFEFCCEKCRKMDTLYYRKEVKNILDIIPLINGSKTPSSSPVLEEDMYNQQYNNVIEEMLNRKES